MLQFNLLQVNDTISFTEIMKEEKKVIIENFINFHIEDIEPLSATSKDTVAIIKDYLSNVVVMNAYTTYIKDNSDLNENEKKALTKMIKYQYNCFNKSFINSIHFIYNDFILNNETIMNENLNSIFKIEYEWYKNYYILFSGVKSTKSGSLKAITKNDFLNNIVTLLSVAMKKSGVEPLIGKKFDLQLNNVKNYLIVKKEYDYSYSTCMDICNALSYNHDNDYMRAKKYVETLERKKLILIEPETVAEPDEVKTIGELLAEKRDEFLNSLE